MQQSETVYGTDRVIADALRERKRQVVVEGFSRGDDDLQFAGRLALAGACYALYTGVQMSSVEHGMEPPARDVHPYWPMAQEWWKPKGPRENLIRAIALLVAEVERYDRMIESANEPTSDESLARLRERTRRLLAYIDDCGDRAEARKVGNIHVHLAPGQELAAIGDRVQVTSRVVGADDQLYQVIVQGLPLSQIGLDKLEWHDGDGQWRPFIGLAVNQGESIIDAVRRAIGPNGQARIGRGFASGGDAPQFFTNQDGDIDFAPVVVHPSSADSSRSYADNGLEAGPGAETSPPEKPPLLGCGDPIPAEGCGCRQDGVPIMRANCVLHGST